MNSKKNILTKIALSINKIASFINKSRSAIRDYLIIILALLLIVISVRYLRLDPKQNCTWQNPFNTNTPASNIKFPFSLPAIPKK